MSEVGALIIRLRAETAQFREDMGKVKSDLNELKGGAQEAGDTMDYSFTKARGSLMLTEASLGVHLPRALNTLIASIPAVGAAFAVMLPLVGIIAAIEIIGKLVEKHREMKEEAFKIEQAQNSLAGTIATTFSGLNDKLLQAGIKADELRGDHLAALQKQLQLIDHQTMQDLAREFDVLAKAADAAFTTLQAHWYQFGSGSDRAKKSLEEFQTKYELLLKTGKDGEANALLDDQIKKEERILQLQKQARDNQTIVGFGKNLQDGDYNKYEEAIIPLREQNIGITEKEIESTQDLVDILHAQAAAHEKVAKIAAAEKNVAVTKDVLKGLSEEATLQKIVTAGTDAHAAAMRKLAQTQAEMVVAQDKGNKQESIDDKLAVELRAIETEKQAAVDAADQILQSKKKVYDAEVKAAGQNVAKKKELDAQYVNEVRAHDDAIAQAEADAQKKSIAVTATASAEKMRMALAAAQAQADGVLQIEIKGAQDQEKAAMQAAKNEEALHKATWRQTLGAEVDAINAEVAAEVQSYQKRIQALDKFASDYEKKVQELNAKIVETEKKGTAEVTALEAAAHQKQLMDTQHAYDTMYRSIADDIAKSIVMNKSLVQSFRQTGEQLLEGMIRNLIMMELTHDKEKLINAKGAFDKSYNWASAWGGPIAGAIAGAASFAAVMAFEQGGKIPGQGAVPIIGHGGETVVTRALTDRVEAAEGKSGSNRGGGDMHVHYTDQSHYSAIDSEGMDEALTKHSTTVQRHIVSVLRKLNKR
jgi:hypothetical protein